MGKFKFKDTRIGQPPTDTDLARIIRNGIPGTAMPSFQLLSDDEIDSLRNYVKYLSIRGQVERRLIEELPDLGDDALLPSASESPSAYSDALAFILEDHFLEVLGKWTKESNHPTPLPPLPDRYLENRPTLAAEGKLLFYGKGNCVQCHGQTGLGDGQTENFDAWTNEWIKRANLDPDNYAHLAEFIERGALPPRRARPRNLRHRILRGGSNTDDIFRRIKYGVDGSPMPASPGLSDAQVWALVAFVQELPFQDSERYFSPPATQR